MNVLFINETCGTGSHGKICTSLARKMEEEGHICRIAYGRSSFVPQEDLYLAVKIGNKISLVMHGLLSRVFDLHGFGSYFATKRFLRWVDKYQPDMIWLHNLHGYYIHVGLLFSWIKKHPKVMVKWTLHDCWSFTGHCAHYMAANCSKWKTQCHHCPEKTQYPASLLIDNSWCNYKRKRKVFTGVGNLSLVTPSKWLAEQTRDSFLKEYPVEVVHNEISKEIFKPIEDVEKLIKIRQKYQIPDNKQIILGVASKWTTRKGWNDFLKLNQMIDNKHQCLVMVGLSEKQIDGLPDTIIGVTRTEDAYELAALYSLADVYVNLTYEENYPTVNLEAEACGTDVLTYDAGGCRETIHRSSSKVYAVGDLNSISSEIHNRA